MAPRRPAEPKDGVTATIMPIAAVTATQFRVTMI
jgi:hypothetical protein